MQFVALAAAFCCSLIPTITATWGPDVFCHKDGVVEGFQLKLGESGLTGIRFFCSDGDLITSKELPSGIWSNNKFRCKSETWFTSCEFHRTDKLVSFVGNARCECSSGDVLTGDGLNGPDENWRNWMDLPCNKGINGIFTSDGQEDWSSRDKTYLFAIGVSCKADE